MAMIRLVLVLALFFILVPFILVDAQAAEPANAAEPTASDETGDYYIRTHGILMSIGWVALLPLGALVAQSRWLQPMRKNVGSKEIWFYLHLALQFSGLALITAAFGIAYSDVAQMEPDPSETVAYAHKIIGTIAFAALLMQFILGLVRPAPGPTRKRRVFNIFHHNWGRLIIILAWVNIWLGVAIWHESTEQGEGSMDFLSWVVPLAVFQGLVFFTYILGMLLLPKRQKEDEDAKEARTAVTGNGAGRAGGNAESASNSSGPASV